MARLACGGLPGRVPGDKVGDAPPGSSRTGGEDDIDEGEGTMGGIGATLATRPPTVALRTGGRRSKTTHRESGGSCKAGN